MATRANRSVRARKLSTKANLAIHHESDGIELASLLEEEARHLGKIVTGVEEGEESEHHLQAIIANAVADSSAAYIPTRDTTDSDLQYDTYYTPLFRQPATYIRFSSTVEDCIGVPYCMGDDDAAFLTSYNARHSKISRRSSKDEEGNGPLSEDTLELLMNFFEQTSAAKQPFASLDPSTPVLPLEDMENSYDECEPALTDVDKRFARDIYDHWKLQRVKRGNTSLMPSLKFEKNEQSDDSDPYVCFRRREIRQARKTRGQGAQVTEKLKRLRVELEQARQLVHFVKQREIGRRDQLAMDSHIFGKRKEVRTEKRIHNIKGDDEDLINQKPEPKPKPVLNTSFNGQRAPNAHHAFPGPRPFNRTDSIGLRTTDAESYPQLADVRRKQSEQVSTFVRENCEKHKHWNKGWVDCTWRPITPPLDDDDDSNSDRERDPLGQELRGWKRLDGLENTLEAGFGGLPTPPASVASPPADEQHDKFTVELQQKHDTLSRASDAPSRNTRSRKPSAPDMPLTIATRSDDTDPIRPHFRQRFGRGGRLMLDRRAPKRNYSTSFPSPPPSSLTHPAYALHPYNLRKNSASSSLDGEEQLDELRKRDRWHYDNDDDAESDEELTPRVYFTDPWENMSVRYRMMWAKSGSEQAAQQHAQVHAAQQQQQMQHRKSISAQA